MDFDLLLAGGRVIDPASGLDAKRDVAFANGRVAAIDGGIPHDRARTVVDAAGAMVTPGLIDLHTHVYWGGTSLGVDAEKIAERSGTTTFVDAGSAGAGNFLGFRAHVIERANVRILAYVNISFPGIFGFAERVQRGECADLGLCDPHEAVACAREHKDIVVGIKVRSGHRAGTGTALAPVNIAVEAADAAQLPLMAHVDNPPPTQPEVLAVLRGGDVLTHCYRPFPNAGVTALGEVKEAVLKARDRGVVFDIGHGMGAFDFEVGKAMLKNGFPPDVISSDVHLLNIDGPAYDLLVSMSKLLVMGMPLMEVLRSATEKPAAAIGRSDLGRLAVGSIGDAAVLRLKPGQTEYRDVRGQVLVGNERLVSAGIVVGGAWRPNDGADFYPGEPGPPTKTHMEALRQHLGSAGGCCSH